MLGGPRFDFGNECDVSDDVDVTLPHSRLSRQASFCQKRSALPRIIPFLLTLLISLLTGWFPAAALVSPAVTGPLGQTSFHAWPVVGDHLTSDTYDANGNTTSSLLTSHSALGTPTNAADIYSFDNRLIRRTHSNGLTIDLTYNPDGHRLTKLVSGGGLTQRVHHYLTDPNNPTGYSQVVEEKDPLASAAEQLQKVHLYGHDLVSSEISSTPNPALRTPHFYTYDGLGSVRGIIDESGELQETYDYDAYGTLIGLAKRNAEGVLESSPISNLQSPITQSEFLFTGEQWDADLGMYFLRARYLNTNTGRFHTQDSYEGRNGEPLTLHKYLYVHGNPVMGTDPSGKWVLLLASAEIGLELAQALDNSRVHLQRSIIRQGIRGSLGKFYQRLGRTTEDHILNALQTLEKQGATIRFADNENKILGKSGNSIPDIIVDWGKQVDIIEVKYSLPSKAGFSLDRLGKQLSNMDASKSLRFGENSTKEIRSRILITHKPPTSKQLKLIESVSPEVQLLNAAQATRAQETWLLSLYSSIL